MSDIVEYSISLIETIIQSFKDIGVDACQKTHMRYHVLVN